VTALHDFLDTAQAYTDSHVGCGGVEDHTSPDAHATVDSQVAAASGEQTRRSP
jgi:hypothetical protein